MRALSLGVCVMVAVAVAFTASADVKYLGVDKKTQGDWKGKYGKDGAIIFDAGGVNGVNNPGKKSDQFRKGVLEAYDEGNSNRWNWATDAGNDKRGLTYVADDGRRIGACAWGTGTHTFSLSVASKDYQVAVYCVDWDSSVRIEDIVGYQDAVPAKADLTVQNPEFNAGMWLLWHVTGTIPFKLNVTHKGGANWVISGIMVDAQLAVDPAGKASTTWSALRSTGGR
ncbi:hypothetical protein FJZ36_13365 [Candidatus Poribacteria bacterium]|nr:hypothetical protein [Candidatus Poribacteria bacterium]